jgi:cytoskeletal protein CcmA (bactofilin family)
VVRKRLLIRAGGHVSGTITYGEIEIESGGKISGAIEEAGTANVTPSLLPIRAWAETGIASLPPEDAQASTNQDCAAIALVPMASLAG